jgi:hypothetical protein
MITDPLPDDRPRVRLPPGWPTEPPPNFAIREGRSDIAILGDWMRKLVRELRARVQRGDTDATRPRRS